MPFIIVRSNENLERALKRFVNSCKKEGLIADMKAHRHFEKPSDKKKRKQKAARRRILKAISDSHKPRY
jgi:small subunit ribosomal protein S21